MNCGFCGRDFEENRGQPACRQCPVGSGCGLVRCPHCGYENPGTPGWISFLKRTFGKSDAAVPAQAARSVSLPMIQPKG